MKTAIIITFNECNKECTSKAFPYFGFAFDMRNNVQTCYCAIDYGQSGSYPINDCNYFCIVSPEYRCGSSSKRDRVSLYFSLMNNNNYSLSSSLGLWSNLIFEGIWKNVNDGQSSTVCQWNNEYIFMIEGENITEEHSSSFYTITDMLSTHPVIHECDDNDGTFSINSDKISLHFSDGTLFEKQQNIRYVLPSLPSYSTQAMPIIDAQAVPYSTVQKRMFACFSWSSCLRK